MIDVTHITFAEHPEYAYCPALPYLKMVRLLSRWRRFPVKYSAAATSLGVFDGGYKNCPSTTLIQAAIDDWWTHSDPTGELPVPSFDPQIVDPYSTITWFDPASSVWLRKADDPWPEAERFAKMWQLIDAYSVWICLLVGCNTMYLELLHLTKRGRPKKGD